MVTRSGKGVAGPCFPFGSQSSMILTLIPNTPCLRRTDGACLLPSYAPIRAPLPFVFHRTASIRFPPSALFQLGKNTIILYSRLSPVIRDVVQTATRRLRLPISCSAATRRSSAFPSPAAAPCRRRSGVHGAVLASLFSNRQGQRRAWPCPLYVCSA